MNAWREVLRVVTVVAGKLKLWLVGNAGLAGLLPPALVDNKVLVYNLTTQKWLVWVLPTAAYKPMKPCFINSTFKNAHCCPQVSGNSGLQDRLVGLHVGIARSLYTTD